MALLKPIVSFPNIKWGVPFDGILWRDERCIEIPLGIQVAATGVEGRVLDAGCAMNGVMKPAHAAHVTHFTQSLDEEIVHDSQNRAYATGDLRELSRYPDQSFDRVVCISTLEHVGMDNSTYGGAVEACPETVQQAVRELWRVCGRSLLITVPFNLQPRATPRWRWFDPDSYVTDIIQQIPVEDVSYRETAFYKRKVNDSVKDGYWIGPFHEAHVIPEAQAAEDKVQQIACLLVQRAKGE